MGIFSSPQEDARKANLKKMEDKRLAFAQELDAQGFKPEKMLFSQAENGGLVAVCRFNSRQWLIVGPGFGSDDAFALESFDRFTVRAEEVQVKAEGLGGMFGFGKKGERGVQYHITRQDGSEIAMPFVLGRNCWAEYTLAKNPLLKTKRRRGDANVVWDMRPIEGDRFNKVMETVESYFS